LRGGAILIGETYEKVGKNYIGFNSMDE